MALMPVQGGEKLAVTTLEPSRHELTWTLGPGFEFKSLLYHL